MVRLETVLDSWKSARQDTAQAVEDFPAAELDFRPTPELMTFGELARHILDAGRALTGLLLEGEENFATPGIRERFAQYFSALAANADAAALAAELRRDMDERCGLLAARDAGFYAHEVTRLDGVRVTRLELLQFVKEHELTHRSQMFLYLRLKGIVPPTTRRRQARR